MTALAATTLIAPARPARASLLGALPAGPAPVPVVTPVLGDDDILGTPDRPGPTFMIAAGSLTVTQTAVLNFGTAAAPTSGSANLVLDAGTNTRTYASTGGLIAADPFARGAFTISGGGAGKSYTVTLPATWTLDTCSITFAYYSATAASATSGLLDATGADTLYVGGTCAIPSTAAAGPFSGSPGTVSIASTKSGSATMTGTAIKIAKPLTLSKTADLSFGDIVAGSSAGTVTVSTAGARTTAGGVLLGNASTLHAANFSLNGEPSAAYNLGVSPTPLSLTGPGTAMTVDTWTISPSSPASLPASPPQTIAVGGTLHVGASQAAGSYTGIFTLTVAYR